MEAPTNSTESGSGSQFSQHTTAIQDISDAHDELLAAYVGVIELLDASFFLLQGFFPVGGTGESAQGLAEKLGKKSNPLGAFAFRPLTRLWVELHLLKRLRELKAMYIHKQITEAGPLERSRSDFFRSASADCDRLASTLSSLPILVTGFVSLLLPLFPFLQSIFRESSLPTALLYNFGFWSYFFGFVIASFAYKRSLMIITPSVVSRGDETSSVYEKEKRLFDSLHRRRRKELPIDFAAGGAITTYYVVALVNITWSLWINRESYNQAVRAGELGDNYPINWWSMALLISVTAFVAYGVLSSVLGWLRRQDR